MRTIPFLSRRKQTSGVALVVVLGFLVLMTALVLSFLIMASGEQKSAAIYSRSGDARQLADSALALAMGQISQATSAATLESGDTRAWASQPGLIRVFGSDGNAYQTYKLYSAADMILDHAGRDSFYPGSPSAPVDVPADWASRPSEFVDLNKRFTVDGTNYYPILDVEAAKGSAPVEGFDLGSYAPASDGEMPVRWLYVLQDGEVSLPSPDGTIRGASKSNPVVGRVAFWTDDESSKININTASEGVFWDVPRGSGAEEMKFSRFAPYANEWQRVAGHPAMTSLSAVLGYKWPVVRQLTQATYNDNLKAYYALAPRTDLGGSMAGTKTVDSATYAPIAAQPKRLFSSIDELLFNDSRGANPLLGEPGPVAAPTLNATDLERAKFFLTAHSRSPDLNLFNLPRVSLWPQMVLTPGEESTRSIKDRLLAFCSEMGGTEGNRPKYYFQRQNSRSATHDWTNIPRNQQLYKYLQNLTGRPIPGVGQSFLGKYGQNDRNQILTSMFDFIRSGVNLIDSSKSPAGDRRNIILPTDFSYPTGTLAAGQVVPIEISPPAGGETTRGFGRYPTVVGVSLIFYYIGRKFDPSNPLDPGYDWMDLDIEGKTWTTSGRVDFDPSSPPAGMNPPISAGKTTRIGATLIVHLFNPSQGLLPYSGDLGISIRGLSGLQVNDSSGPVPTNFPSQGTTRILAWGNATEGGYGDWFSYTLQTGNSNAGAFEGNQSKRLRHNTGETVAEHAGTYAFVAAGSGVFTGPDQIEYPYLDIQGPNFGFSGTNIEIQIRPAHYDNPRGTGSERARNASRISDDVVQTIQLNIPSANNLPVPTPDFYKRKLGSPANSVGFYAPLSWRRESWLPYRQRINGTSAFTGKKDRQGGVTPGDVVRSIVLNPSSAPAGDVRLVAARKEVPASFFSPAPGYTSSVRIADGGIARSQTGIYERFGTNVLEGGLGGSLVDGITYWSEAVAGVNTGRTPALFNPSKSSSGFPLVPGSKTALAGSNETFFQAAENSQNRPGDWDNGTGNVPDGPFINKPDEGHDRGLGTGGGSLETQEYPAYYRPLTWQDAVQGKTFSPNRQIASPVMFGSLPSRVFAEGPWETLLFAPNPPAGRTEAEHRGFAEPKDHYLLDLFTMPIVEPYAISEPYSTAGRINMNYRIAPFTYIRRATGLHGVIKPIRLTAIPDASANRYKQIVNPMSVTEIYRKDLDTAAIEQTLRQFEEKFESAGAFNDGKHMFLSASEICDVLLVPRDQTLETIRDPDGFWATHRLTGDNSREAPYNDLYPRLTTRSNTFTVHVVAQALQQVSGESAGNGIQWREDRDRVRAEWRGSFTIERYIPENGGIPDFAADTPPSESLAGKYRIRVLRSKQFSP
jgi:uncharacterized protein (TIGR02600 family)